MVLRNLPAHTRVSLGFLLAVIDSWDGAELLRVSVDGQEQFSHWFRLALGDTSSYVAPPGGLLSLIRLTQGGEQCTARAVVTR